MCDAGAGTFGAVRAAVYTPKNGEPRVECAVKCLKTDNHGTNEKVSVCVCDTSRLGSTVIHSISCRVRSFVKLMQWPCWITPILSDYMVCTNKWVRVQERGCVCVSGIVVTTPIMLVMEIASLGPLNKFLRKHP